jgi:hypothetical protein
MAAGDSQVSISNMALSEIGEDLIATMNDPYKRAQLCQLHYDPQRRALLEQFPWNFAMTQVALAASPTAPITDVYDNAYPLPADCLRMHDIPDVDEADWVVWSGQLLTDEDPPLTVLYIRDEQDTTLFPALFTRALSLGLAIAVARGLTASNDVIQDVTGRYNEAMETARLASSQADSPKEWDDDVMLRARR